MRLAIAIPTNETVPASFMYDLAQLVLFTTEKLPEGWQFGITMVSGTYVHSARQQLAEALLQQDVDLVLWLDSDMRFPRDLFLRLYRHGKQFVGINYATRGLPPRYVALKSGAERLVTDESSAGLEEAEAVGFGAVLMDASVLRVLPDPRAKPWFWFDWQDGQQVGEDVHFCRLVRAAGVPIHVDHDASKLCAHVGQFAFDLRMVESEVESAGEAVLT